MFFTGVIMKFRTPFANEILTYIAGRPRARDTLEGILHWWLMERLMEIHEPEVKASVEELVEKGLVLVAGPSENPIYRLNPETTKPDSAGVRP